MRWIRMGLLLMLSLLALTGCGGGGSSDTNGILLIDTVTVSGSYVTVRGHYANATDIEWPDVPIKISTDEPALVDNVTVRTDQVGYYSAILRLKSAPTTPTLNIVASTGGLRDISSVVLDMPTLTITPSVSGSVVYVQVEYSSDNAPTLDDVPVIISTDQAGLIDPITVTTDAAGKALATMPLKLAPSVSTINFVATTGTLLARASVGLTIPSISLSLNKTNVSLGTTLVATATYSNVHDSSLAGENITFVTDRPDVFDNVVVPTDNSGKAIAYLVPKNTITSPVNVNIYATNQDISSPSSIIQVKPESLTVAAPEDSSKSVASTVNGSVRFVPAGVENFTITSSGDGQPLANKNVTLSVQTVLNSTNSVVTFWQDYPSTPSTTPTSITVATDSMGKFPNQTTVDVDFVGVPVGSTSTRVITVIWKVTYDSPSGELVGYASTQYTVENAP